MQQYEIVVLYHPDLEIDLEKPMKKIEDIIASNGGSITATDNWGKRKLAYRIAKSDYAVYVIYSVEMPTDAVKKINDIFNITDEVIRFLITKPDFKKIAKAEELKKIQEERAKRNAAESEKADETSTDADKES
jgi:small subunit ribosomal protein S6